MNKDTERGQIARGSGKWSQADVPHKGWTCTDIEDLGAPDETCGMCETQAIRYVHYMEHPDYPDTLGVGCVCAERMEEDYVNPRLREKRLRSKARRRLTWAKRKWKTSEKGNSYLNTEGFRLTVFSKKDRQGEFWGLCVSHRESGASEFGKYRYPSEADAKKAALDALLWAKEHLVQ